MFTKNKKILIYIANPFVVKNVLTTDVLRILQDTVHVIIAVPEARYASYVRRFGGMNVSFYPIPSIVTENKTDFLYQFFTQNSLSTNTVKIKHYNYLFHNQRSIPVRFFVFLVVRLLWYLGKISWWKKVIGYSYRFLSPRSFRPLFDEHDFDLIYLPLLLHSTDMRILLEAKRRGIKTVGSILSWDNLTAKLLLPFLPDRVLVPNKLAKKDLISYDGAQKQQIDVVGYPQYDRYFKKEAIMSREVFCTKLGLDPDKSYILYAMAGPKNMPSDIAILRSIRNAISDGILPQVQVLIRPYPKYIARRYEEETLSENPLFIFDRDATTLVEGTWDMLDKDIERLSNSIYHAALVVSVGSTILIEGIVFDKPIINIGFSGDEKVTNKKEYYSSPRRFLDYEHMNRLWKQGLLKTAMGTSELIDFMKLYLLDPHRDQNARNDLKKMQCEYTDGKSGERIARQIVQFIAKEI